MARQNIGTMMEEEARNLYRERRREKGVMTEREMKATKKKEKKQYSLDGIMGALRRFRVGGLMRGATMERNKDRLKKYLKYLK